MQLAPAVDIARAPRGGRTFESFGEDPLLQARMVVPEIHGIQAHPVQATIKHFIANNQEYRRFTVDVRVDERTLHEIYLPPFEAAIRDGGVAAAMASFNRVNGAYASEHPGLLSDVLRGELGFRGWVMSDYEATWSTAAAANAGLDQEQPAARFWGPRLVAAVTGGEVDSRDARRDGAAHPAADDRARPRRSSGGGRPRRRRRRTPARRARSPSRGSCCSRTPMSVLPIGADVRSIAVIGPEADNVSAAGAGSGFLRPLHEVSPLDGIRRRAGADVRVTHAPGADALSAADLLPGPPAIPSAYLAPPDGQGSGLLAEYWANPRFEGEPLLTRTDPQVAINLGFFNIPHFNAISPRLPATPMELNGRISVRWRGMLTADTTGTHRLSLTSLGSASLSLDGSTILRVRGDGLHGPPVDHDAFPPLPPLVPDEGPRIETVEVELVAGVPRAIEVEYAADSAEQNDQIGAQVRLGWEPPPGSIPPLVREAALLAAGCDVAVVVAPTYESEMMDRPGLDLPSQQDLLISEVAAANPRTIVVLMSGGPVATAAWDESIPALLEAWYAGQEQGDAIARVLFGDVNPSGKLPLTFPIDEARTPLTTPEQYPGVDGVLSYSEGILVGYRGYDQRDLEPRFAFGHGLSYTAFAYDGLELEATADRRR